VPPDRIIIGDLLTEIGGIVRGEPPKKTNGSHPPPDSMERWAVIRKDTGEVIHVYRREAVARTVAGTSPNAKQPAVKKLDP
jgi:hypothetical protein